MGLDLHAGTPGTEENEYEDTWYAPGLHAHWSYGGFGIFREKLAVHEGFFLDDMDGFTKDGRSWDLVATDLKPLLDHSDCDGEMTPDEARQAWPRLAAILDEWEAGGDPRHKYDIQSGRSLVEILQYCAEHGTQVLFC